METDTDSYQVKKTKEKMLNVEQTRIWRLFKDLKITKRHIAIWAVSLVREIWNLYCYDTQPE